MCLALCGVQKVPFSCRPRSRRWREKEVGMRERGKCQVPSMIRKRLKYSWKGPSGEFLKFPCRHCVPDPFTLGTQDLGDCRERRLRLQASALAAPLHPCQVVPGGSVPHLQGAPRRAEDSPTPPGGRLPFSPTGRAGSIKPGVRGTQEDLDRPSLGPAPDPSSQSCPTGSPQ